MVILGTTLSAEGPCITLLVKAIPYLERKEKGIACLLQVRIKEVVCFLATLGICICPNPGISRVLWPPDRASFIEY